MPPKELELLYFLAASPNQVFTREQIYEAVFGFDKESDNSTIATHIKNNQNFFDYEPDEEYEFIVSNPPFSIKDDILKRLSELNKPFAMLLPLPTLQGQKRFEYLQDCQAIIFDKRINYYKNKETKEIQKGVAFASIYICKDILPKGILFELLEVE